MSRIRYIINNNKLYAWIIITILFIHSYAILMHKTTTGDKSPQEAKLNFKQELETHKNLMQKVILQNPQVALNLAYISFFIVLIFLLGIIFLANFIYIKLQGNEPIPKTLEADSALWSWKDAIKIAIIFIFLNDIFFIFENLVAKISKTPGLDKRASMILDTLGMDILIFLFIIYFVVVKYKQRITALGISIKNILKNVGIALIAYIGFLPILAIMFISVMIIAKWLNYTPEPEPIYELIFKEKRPSMLMAVYAMATLISPVIEEIFFRGFLYSGLKKSLSAAKAIVVSAFIFSLLHTNVLGFAPIVALGIFLAYLREKTGSLIPSICVHMIHNTALASLMFFVRKILTFA